MRGRSREANERGGSGQTDAVHRAGLLGTHGDLGEPDPLPECLESRVGAERVDPWIDFEIPDDVEGSFPKGFLEEGERLVLVAKAGVDRRDHVRRDVDIARLVQQIAQDLFSLGPSAEHGVGVRQGRTRILIAAGHLDRPLELGNGFGVLAQPLVAHAEKVVLEPLIRIGGYPSPSGLDQVRIVAE